jgi:hypothetical protein
MYPPHLLAALAYPPSAALPIYRLNEIALVAAHHSKSPSESAENCNRHKEGLWDTCAEKLRRQYDQEGEQQKGTSSAADDAQTANN